MGKRKADKPPAVDSDSESEDEDEDELDKQQELSKVPDADEPFSLTIPGVDEMKEMPDICQRGEAFSVASVGKRYAGKTGMLLHLVKPEDFDEVYVFTLSKHTGNLDQMVKDKRQIFNSCSDALLEHFLEKQEKPENQNNKMLLVFDDFIGMKFSMDKSKPMEVLASSGRNFNISMWFNTQDRVKIPPIVRRNCEWWLIGNNFDQQMENCVKEMAMPGRRAMMREALRKLSQNKANQFIVYDDKNQELGWFRVPPNELKVKKRPQGKRTRTE